MLESALRANLVKPPAGCFRAPASTSFRSSVMIRKRLGVKKKL
jgi:hypothetical protein